jgi:hypothetical protein
MVDGGHGLVVHLETWDSIGGVAKEANSDFEIIQESLRNFFDRMQEEVAKWKRRCGRLQTMLQSVSVTKAIDQAGVPPKPTGVTKSSGRHSKNN